jgi:mannose-1-phosphate guanylyltransferase/phosphomannomutase
VDDGAHLVRTITWKNVRVGKQARLVDTVLCDDVTTGKDVRMERGGIVAGGTEVGDGVTFEKDIMIWPNKMIEAGSTLSANMVWGDKWKKSVFEGGVVRGNTNVELSPEFAAKMGAALGSILPAGSSILVSRDYLRPSRMLKRAFLGGILSTGVNVHDVKMTPVPVARYKMAGFGEEAGVHFQQSEVGARQIEISFYDQDGNLIDTGKEKSIERLFFKENFRRVDHSDVGAIQELTAVPEFYREGFMRALDVEAIRARRFQVVLDLAFGTTGDYIPSLLNRLGCQPIVLNAYPDERRLMRRTQETGEALRQVSEIVKTLGADVGFCVSPGGESLHVIDDRGVVHPEHQTAMVFLHLLASASSKPVRAFLPVTEPRVMDNHPSLRIIRGKTTSVRTSDLLDCAFVSQGEGRFAFPDFLHAPDAMFAVAKLLELLAGTGARISEAYAALPAYAYRRSELPCPVEKKGLAMRRMSEDSVDKEASFVDGIQVFVDHGSVLLLPDPHRPVLHLVAEADTAAAADKLIKAYGAKTAAWLAE